MLFGKIHDMEQDNQNNQTESKNPQPQKKPEATRPKQPKEYGGRKDGLDPTRYGDWEKNGRCIDF